MARSLNTYVSQIQPRIRDRTNGTVEVSDIKEALNRGIRTLIGEYGIYASQNWSVLKVFPTVHEYPLPTDFHDVINIQKRTGGFNYARRTPAEFWMRLNQENDILAVTANQGDRYLLLKSQNSGASSILNACDSLTSNGTWAVDAASDSTNLTVDTVDFMDSTGSLNFDVTVAQHANNYAAIACTGMTQVDLTNMADKGVLFMWVYIPSVTNFTSVNARWGNDSSNYYANTVTAQYNGQSLVAGWNRLGFAWSGSTETGSVTDTAIDYLRVQFTYTASYTNQTDFRVDDIRMESPELMELHYYSRNFCQTSAGVAQQVFVSTDDTTLLTDEEDDVLFWYALAEGLEIKEAPEVEVKKAKDEFERAKSWLQVRHGSDRKRPSRRYY